MIPEKTFAAVLVMAVADLLQLPPVTGKLVFSQFSDKNKMKYLLGMQLWHLFKYAKLTEVVRPNDKLFIDLLKKIRAKEKSILVSGNWLGENFSITRLPA